MNQLRSIEEVAETLQNAKARGKGCTLLDRGGLFGEGGDTRGGRVCSGHQGPLPACLSACDGQDLPELHVRAVAE